MSRNSDGPEPLSGPDNAWRRMGDRTNLMEITGVLTFDDPIEYEELREVVAERLLPFRRFRQRIVGRDFGRRPRWELDPDFDLDSHVHHVALPEPQDRETFQEFVGKMMSTPIDRTKPLWQFHLVEGAGEGNALVVRIHHSIADGFALLYVMFGLADDPSTIEMPFGSVPSPPSHAAGDRTSRSGRAESSGATASDGGAASEAGDSPTLTDRLSSLGRVASRGANMAATAYRSVTMSDEVQTPLVGDLGVQKHAAWTDRIDVDRVKAIGRAHDATINDVLLAATAGALRRYLESVGEDVDEDLVLRSTVPVNLKPLDERTEDLGNYFGLGFLELPVGRQSVDDRLREIRDNTGVLKQGTQAYLLYLLLTVFGRGPPTAQKLALQLFRDKASAVVTNVPGPIDSFTLAGKEVSDIMFWVPQSNGIGIGVSIFSYDGSVRVGVASDAGLVAEPFDLAEAFEAEIQELAANVDLASD